MFYGSLPSMLLLPILSLFFSFFLSSGELEALRMNCNGARGLPSPRPDKECLDDVDRDRLVMA